MVLGLVLLASTCGLYALAHKRVQDIGYPGWYALAITIVQAMFAPLGGMLFLLLACWPGESEENPWGPPPVSPATER